jgi:multidrug efflux system membrane fusion protein
VQIGLTTSTSTDVLKGLAEGERVVVDGTDRLVDGAVVRVRKAGELDNPADTGGTDPGGRGRRRGNGGQRSGGGGNGQ